MSSALGLGFNPSGLLIAYTYDGASFDSVASTSYTANAWHHCVGVWPSMSSRTSYLNGAASATSVGSRNITNLFRLNIGGFGGLSVVDRLTGEMAEVGIWNDALTAAEIASLAKGMTCDKVRPQSLVFYAPLVRDLIDQKGGLTITNNNGATVANHPRIYP
jgi:hypothetical protein